MIIVKKMWSTVDKCIGVGVLVKPVAALLMSCHGHI